MKRRSFLGHAARAALLALVPAAGSGGTRSSPARDTAPTDQETSGTRLLLCGDVMTGRGIDQILRTPSNPTLHERSAKSALEYVALAERANGAIPRPVAPGYIWGDMLRTIDRLGVQARIANLETAVTTSDAHWIGKRIHYRMHPANVDCLTAARLDCCTLANNHVVDWAYTGLRETLRTLHDAGIQTAGAGDTLKQARVPAVIELGPHRRILVFAYGSVTSGIPSEWAAQKFGGGVNAIDESDPMAVERVADDVRAIAKRGDLVVVSVHWGGNWGYEVTPDQQRLARGLIDGAGVHVVQGHSSHHPRPIEVYKGKLVLYGCGDCINDYEGIRGHEAFRPDLGFLYVPELDPLDGRLRRLTLVPTRLRRFQLTPAPPADATWLTETLQRVQQPYRTRFRRSPDGSYELVWG